MIDLWIVGAGGHARVVYDSAMSTGKYNVRAFIDDDAKKWGSTIYDMPIIGPIGQETIESHKITCAVMGIGGNELRAQMVGRLQAVPQWATIVHDRAYIAIGAVLGAGTVVFAGSTVQTESVIGDHVIVNTNSCVDHESQLDDFCHIASARVGARAHIGAGAMICIGAVVIPDVVVGSWSVLGAGAVATREVPSDTLAVGVPAVVKASSTMRHNRSEALPASSFRSSV